MKEEFYQVYDEGVPISQGKTIEEAIQRIPNAMVLKTEFSKKLDIMRVTVEPYAKYSIKPVVEILDNESNMTANKTATLSTFIAPIKNEIQPAAKVVKKEVLTPPAKVLADSYEDEKQGVKEVIIPISVMPVEDNTVYETSEENDVIPVILDGEEPDYSTEDHKSPANPYQNFDNYSTVDPSTLIDPDIKD